MAKGARVQSVEELGAFRAFLAQLGDAVAQGVGAADAEVQRVARWLDDERPAELAAAGRRARRALEAATDDLRRKRMQPTPTGAPPSVDVERQQQQRARAAAERVEELQKSTGRWARAFATEATEYAGQVQGARDLPHTRVPRAVAQLERHLAALDAYANANAAGGGGDVDAGGAVARPAGAEVDAVGGRDAVAPPPPDALPDLPQETPPDPAGGEV